MTRDATLVPGQDAQWGRLASALGTCSGVVRKNPPELTWQRQVCPGHTQPRRVAAEWQEPAPKLTAAASSSSSPSSFQGHPVAFGLPTGPHQPSARLGLEPPGRYSKSPLKRLLDSVRWPSTAKMGPCLPAWCPGPSSVGS